MTDDEPETTNGGTTEQDYRWKWLSTLYVLGYGLGFPAWLLGSALFDYSITLDGTVLGVMVLVWLACVIYVIGPENVKAAQQIRGG